MLLTNLRRFSTVRPKLRSGLQHRLSSSNKTFAIDFANTGWQKKFAGAVIGASGIIACIFGIKDAFAEEEKKKRVIVLGSGWGAVSFLKNLKPGVYDVVVVSPTNYFIFTPFLASVTVGTIEARTICEPIRKILGRRHKNNAHFYEAECTDIDVENKRIVCVKENEDEKSTFTLDYDALIIAVGAETSTFNIKGVKEHTHPLKEIIDVQMIRNNIINSLENASYPGRTEEEIRKLLHFVVVGGGPTGVEFAAELSDFMRNDLEKLYPELHHKINITLIDGYNKLLSTYDEEISSYVESRLNKDNVNCITSTFVTEVEDGTLHLMDAVSKEKSTMPFGMCVWAAGIGPRPLTKSFIAKIPSQTNLNAILTDNYLHVPDAEGVYALGDCATIALHRLADEVQHLFKLADKNKDGSLSLDEFEAIMDKAKEDYPHVSDHFIKAYDESRAKAFAAADVDKDQSLSVEEFQNFLSLVDKELKSLPATAQVAAQQGKYLGKLFTKHPDAICLKDGVPDNIKPFVYNHLGSFAYIGSNRAVLQMPGVGVFKGLATMWLWRASYMSECVGIRMKALVFGDWLKSATVGRDTSRI